MYRPIISQSVWIPTRTVASLRLLSRPAYRTFATAPPPSGQPAPNPMAKKGSNNTFLYAVFGAAAAGSAYYYFTQDQGTFEERKVRAKADEERLKSKARDAIDTAKDKSVETEKRAKEEYQQLKDKVAGLKTTVERDLRASEVRGKSIGEDLESKYESAKGAARNTLNRTRDSTENLYQEARSSAEHKVHDTREAADEKATEIQQGWFSWLGWGKTKVEGGKENVAREADRLQREGGGKR